MPWTEIDYMFLNTCPPVYVQLKEKFPEIEAVNALYTHGLVVIVSTKVRVGGFGKAVGMSVLTTPHGLGYAKVVIVVDDFVDPFNLPQVMWALSTNPRSDRFKEDIIQAFYDGMKHRPDSTFGTVNDDVIADKEPGFTRGNFCAVIRGSAWPA
jgi:UbiD family decarboxylase